MPRRRDERARVLGPHKIESRGYYRVTTILPGATAGTSERRDRFFHSEEEALEYRDLKREELSLLSGVSVAMTLDKYEQHLADRNNENSREERMRRLRLFFTPVADLQVTRLTEKRAAKLYDDFRRGRSVDYHRNTLGNAKGFWAWCVAQGLSTTNPISSIQGVGQRSAGKAQLTGDEARRFYSTALRMAHQGDDGALGAAMLLAMGLRQGEVRQRRVRDLDLDGTVLRIEKGKTRKARRPVDVPASLRGPLLDLTEDRAGDAVLFDWHGGEHTRAWLYAAVHRVCDEAEVPRVCPHGLRGTHATLAMELGQVPSAVADSLGHEDVRTTARHYAAPGGIEAGTQRRALALLMGWRG